MATIPPSTTQTFSENYLEQADNIGSSSVKKITTLETKSSLPAPILSILRWAADKLAKYQSPPAPIPLSNTSDLVFPVTESQPIINIDSHVAKLGFLLDEDKGSITISLTDSPESQLTPVVEKIHLEELNAKELVVWIAKYLSGKITQVSQTALLKSKKEDYLLDKLDSASPAFRNKLETAVYNLLKTIAKQDRLGEEVSLLAQQLVTLANQAKFPSCQEFIDQFINQGVIGINQPREDFRITQIPPFDLGNMEAVSAVLGVSPMPSGQFYLPLLGQTLDPATAQIQASLSTSRRFLTSRTFLSSPINLQSHLPENPIITITSIDELPAQPTHNYKYPPVSDFYINNISKSISKRRRYKTSS